MVAAIAGWLYEVWPANPYTLALAGGAVVGGPLIGILHVATAHEPYESEQAEPRFQTAVPRRVPAQDRTAARTPAPAPAPAPLALTAKAEAARQFHSWRDRVHPAIERRERERRASQYIRSS
jgi:hypothetical protein